MAKGGQPFDSQNRFEFYNFGHLLQAAKSFANLIVERFAQPNRMPYRMNRGPLHLKREHPNHQLALIELFRLTGDRTYLDFANQTLDEYDYWSQGENEGHAVLYMETGEPAMLER